MSNRFLVRLFLSVALLLSARTLWSYPRFFTLQNESLARTLMVDHGVLRTSLMVNKQSGVRMVPTACPEFSVRFSQGTDKPGTAVTLTSADFKVKGFRCDTVSDERWCVYTLSNRKYGLNVSVEYRMNVNDFYGRKQLSLTWKRPYTIEKVDVEAIAFPDAHQNYNIHQISPDKHGGWKPGLGQPVYTTRSAIFWGTEFPASFNTVDADGLIACGYYRGKAQAAGKAYRTYASVYGVAPDAASLDDAFYDYIDRIRIRPARLQVQYNSWFDYGNRVTRETFARSVRKVNHELVDKRGCDPLDAYTIDDGWEDKGSHADWRQKVWTINKKFSPDFASSLALVDSVHSHLGLWLSPASIFGARSMVARMRDYGWEALDYGMSMSGEKYMSKLQERMVELARLGVSYFKLDGIFGHLNLRDFELQGRGTAAMPQLGLDGMSTHDARLNDARYDELKSYYLSAGTERLMQILDTLHRVNPSIFLSLSNGAYLSPWWLMHADIVWLINCSDAAKGQSRSGELAYRDHVYYDIWVKDHTKFPMNSIFNHEPKKLSARETPEDFRNYLLMSLSRGTGFIELYVKVDSLKARDWDVLADGLKWARRMFPTFKHVRYHGGDPKRGQVYGYTAWTDRQGYISIHNPSDAPKTYHVVLDKTMGVVGNGNCRPLLVAGSSANVSLRPVYAVGDGFDVSLAPHDIVVMEFNR